MELAHFDYEQVNGSLKSYGCIITSLYLISYLFPFFPQINPDAFIREDRLQKQLKLRESEFTGDATNV